MTQEICARQIVLINVNCYIIRPFSELVALVIITYIYNTIVGATFLISLASFRFHFAWHLKFFSVLLGLTFFVEAATVFMLHVLHIKSDLWVYNLFMPVEYVAYAYYYQLILKTKWIKQAISIFMFAFPITGLASTFIVFKFYNWNSYEAIVGSFFTIIFAVSYYYELYMEHEERNLKTSAEFWIATGMIVFYSCLLPFVGTLNYLVKTSPSLALIFSRIVNVLGIIMYLFFSYSFICRINIRKLP